LRAPATPDQARHHGSLKAAGEATIMQYIDELLEQNRLRQYERQGYLVLAATMQGRAEAEAWLAEHPELNQYAPSPEAEPDIQAESPAEGEKYTSLQRALWLWRRRVAEQQGQPPYMIMTNELILRIAERRPQTLEELAMLPGMGAQRLDHYGPSILDIVQLNPAHSQDAELLAAQRIVVTEGNPRTALPLPDPRLIRQIYLKLQELRQKKAVSQRTKPHLIASTPLLKAISDIAPETVEYLNGIQGFGTSGLKDDAQTIVDMIAQLRATVIESVAPQK
jgi:superfamily II DNA helicase RecQ